MIQDSAVVTRSAHPDNQSPTEGADHPAQSS